ncbi:MAG: AsmA-like C-terminal region-containing protein, partial [Bacteroidia bacterium]
MNFTAMESATYNNPIKDEQPKKRSIIGTFFKIVKWLFLGGLLSIATLISLVIVYEDEVKEIIIKEINKKINAEVRIAPENINLTIIKSFPDCALEFTDIVCMEAVKKKNRDTLFMAHQLQLRFSVKDLWEKNYKVKKILISEGFCRLKVNSNGQTNYNIWNKSGAEKSSSDSLSFELERIDVMEFNFYYKDNKQRFLIDTYLSDVFFNGAFSSDEYELGLESEMKINRLLINSTNLFAEKNVIIKAKLDVIHNDYKIKSCNMSINKMNLNIEGQGSYKKRWENVKLKYNATNLDFKTILSLLKENYNERIKNYESEGEFYIKGELFYNNSLSLFADFGINNTSVVYVPENYRLDKLHLLGSLIYKENESKLSLNEITAQFGEDRIEGNIELVDFKNPKINLSAKGKIDLSNINKFWPIDTLDLLQGNLRLDLTISSLVSDLRKNKLSADGKLFAKADIKNLGISFKESVDTTKVETCLLETNGNNISVKELKLKKGISDFTINGELEGVLAYIFDNNNYLSVHGSLQSNKFKVEDLLYRSNESTQSEKTSVTIPNNLYFNLDASFNEFTFGKVVAKNLKGNFEMKDKKLISEGLVFETMNGVATSDAILEYSEESINVVCHTSLKKIDVKQLFYQLNSFNQNSLTDENVEGTLTAEVLVKGKWNLFLEPDYKSIYAESNILIEKGRLNDYKPLEKLSKYVDISDLKDIRFSDLNSEVKVENEIISISKTTINNSALNILFNGTHSFNNEIDYHIRLLISDLLAKKRKNNDTEFGPIENDPNNRR